jgi:hypothetical protein
MLSVLSWDEWDYCGEYTTSSLSKRQYCCTHFQIQSDLNQYKYDTNFIVTFSNVGFEWSSISTSTFPLVQQQTLTIQMIKTQT